jgi:hypothetical protein
MLYIYLINLINNTSFCEDDKLAQASAYCGRLILKHTEMKLQCYGDTNQLKNKLTSLRKKGRLILLKSTLKMMEGYLTVQNRQEIKELISDFRDVLGVSMLFVVGGSPLFLFMAIIHQGGDE